jgi:hypothetical protein
MNTLTELQNYKHDIPGKLKTISAIINRMDENFLSEKSSHETLLAIHEVLLKMVFTSRDFIGLASKAKLIVKNTKPQSDLQTLSIDNLIIRYEVQSSLMNFYYFMGDNKGEHQANLEKIISLLPITKIERNG